MPKATRFSRRTFGQAIRRQRERLGFSQEEFAERANVHRTYISSIELGKVSVGTSPKTEESAKAVPIIEPLTRILADLRQADGNPASGPILRGPSGKPLNLDNLSKLVLSPLLKAAKVEWHGWYSLRRGVATTLASLSRDPLASKGLLRHSSLATTQKHYIKDVPENTLAAMNRLEALFNDCSTAEARKVN